METQRAKSIGAALVLVLGVALAFGGSHDHGWVGLDDGRYVFLNPHVRQGLSWEGLAWAFTTNCESNWHPLTWLSHQLDASLFGDRPGPQHLVSLALHAVSAVLGFALLRRWGIGLAVAFAAAALFAWHPLRVESVVWIAERKDVLSVAFGLATLHAWTSWRRSGGLAAALATHAAYAASLLSKPTLVTLPLLLVLLEFWPLGTARSLAAALRATLPRTAGLFVLALGSCVVTYAAQEAGGSVSLASELAPAAQVSNAFVSLVVYLRQTLWPAELSVFYPHTRSVDVGPLLMALTVLAALSALAWRARRSLPELAVGWAWYLGALVPMLGLVQVGLQAHADRYTYWPALGLSLALAGAARACATSSTSRGVLAAVATVALAACLVATRAQTAHWKDGVTLFEHARRCVREDVFIRFNLGNAYYIARDLPRAAEHYEAALRLEPRFPELHNNLGGVYGQQGRLDEALALFEAALQSGRETADLRANRGVLQLRSQRQAEAAREFERALALDPDHFIARLKFGLTLGMLGRPAEALPHLERAEQLAPGDLETCRALGLTYFLLGREREAIAAYRRGLVGAPFDSESLKSLAWLLAMAEDPTLRDARAALELAERALARSPAGDARLQDVLGAARAGVGDFAGAVAATERALELYRAAGRTGAAEQVARRLVEYRAGREAH